MPLCRPTPPANDSRSQPRRSVGSAKEGSREHCKNGWIRVAPTSIHIDTAWRIFAAAAMRPCPAVTAATCASSGGAVCAGRHSPCMWLYRPYFSTRSRPPYTYACSSLGYGFQCKVTRSVESCSGDVTAVIRWKNRGEQVLCIYGYEDITSASPAVIYKITKWTRTLLVGPIYTPKKLLTYVHAMMLIVELLEEREREQKSRLFSLGQMHDLDVGLHRNSCWKI